MVNMFRILDIKIHHKLNANSKDYKGKIGMFNHIINFTFTLTKYITEKDKRHMETQRTYMYIIYNR